MANYFKNLGYTIITIIILGFIGGVGFIVFNNARATDFSSEKIVQKYIKILDNPSKDIITSSEKEVLGEIVETSTVASWFNQAENQIKTLRYFKQGKPIVFGKINYSGQDENYATVVLTFNNDLKGDKSKTATLYLQKQGNFFTGYRWRIYQIDLPEEQNALDQIKNQSQDLLQNLPSIPNPFSN